MESRSRVITISSRPAWYIEQVLGQQGCYTEKAYLKKQQQKVESYKDTKDLPKASLCMHIQGTHTHEHIDMHVYKYMNMHLYVMAWEKEIEIHKDEAHDPGYC